MKLSKISMNETFSSHGLGYFDNMDSSYGGVLNYTKEEITFSFVKEGFYVDEKEDLNVNEVYFMTSDGEWLKLLDGYIKNVKANSNNITTIDLGFNYLLVDLDPLKEEVKEFNSLRINCSFFKDIFTNSPFKYKRSKEGRFVNELNTDLSSAFGVCIKDSKIEIKDFLYATQDLQKDEYYLNINYIPFVQIKFNEGKDFTNILKEAMRVRNLISFVSEHRIIVEQLYVMSSQKVYKVFFTFNSGIRLSKNSTQLLSQVKPFVRRNFPEVISSYYILEDKFDDIIDTYVNNLYKPIYLDDYLLSHVIILEGLHTRFHNNNSKSLRCRLKEVIRELDEELLRKLSKEVKIDDEVIDYLVKFRNYHSHLFSRDRKPSLDIDKYQLATVLRKVIKEYIYLQMNIGEIYELSKPRQYNFKELG